MRLRLCLGLLALGIALTGVSIADDKPKGQLPPHYSKLGLTDKQKSKVQEVRGKYASEIDELKKKIDEIRKKEKDECEQVLTAEQKERLREILKEKGPGEDKKSDN